MRIIGKGSDRVRQIYERRACVSYNGCPYYSKCNGYMYMVDSFNPRITSLIKLCGRIVIELESSGDYYEGWR